MRGTYKMVQRLVSVSIGGFIFCRYSIAILIWLAYIFAVKELMVATFIILFLSALLTVKRAPMILLYTYTIDKIFKSKNEFLDLRAMRFAHSLGAILSLIALGLLYGGFEQVGWTFTLVFALLKTVSALGFCPASKLFGCVTDDACCTFIKNKSC